MEPQFAHQSKTKEVFKSKHEMWKFVAGPCGVYLPDYDRVSM